MSQLIKLMKLAEKKSSMSTCSLNEQEGGFLKTLFKVDGQMIAPVHMFLYLFGKVKLKA